MPTSSKSALRKFLLNLVEKPQALHQLKKNPNDFINNSTLAKTHKQVLLGNNLKKIKSLVSDAVAMPEFAIGIHKDAMGQRVQNAAFQIHIGVAQPQVQISLKRSASKLNKIEVSAIHITVNPNT
jgi:hypothetical protein